MKVGDLARRASSAAVYNKYVSSKYHPLVYHPSNQNAYASNKKLFETIINKDLYVRVYSPSVLSIKVCDFNIEILSAS